ncbi:MAG: hypothetical protein D6683_01375 [Actinomyces sp.]|nr:MAG: hypothetical protein D6683_01375 [Actinomyces sp.]
MAYTTVADVRSFSAGDDVASAAVFPDAVVQAGIDYATELIDDWCATSFEAKSFTATMDGTGTDRILLADAVTGRPILFPRSITSATVDGTAVADTSGWVLHPDGLVVRDAGTFPVSTQGRNVTIVGTAGVTTTVPADIKLAAEMIARDYVLSTADRVHERALQITDDVGVQVFAQPGKHGPTGIPRVNEILRRRRVAVPVIG